MSHNLNEVSAELMFTSSHDINPQKCSPPPAIVSFVDIGEISKENTSPVALKSTFENPANETKIFDHSVAPVLDIEKDSESHTREVVANAEDRHLWKSQEEKLNIDATRAVNEVKGRLFSKEELEFVGKVLFATYNEKNFDEVVPSEAEAGIKHFLDKTNEWTEFESGVFLSTFQETVVEFVEAKKLLEQGFGPLMVSLQVFGTDEQFSSKLFESMRASLGGGALSDLAQAFFRLFDIDGDNSVSMGEIMEVILFIRNQESRGTFLEFVEPMVPALFRFFSDTEKPNLVSVDNIIKIAQSFLGAFEGLIKALFCSLEEFLKGGPLDMIHTKVCKFLWDMVKDAESESSSDTSEIQLLIFIRYLMRNWSDLPEDSVESAINQLEQQFSIQNLEELIRKVQADLENLISKGYDNIMSDFKANEKEGKVLKSTCIDFTSERTREVLDEIRNLCLNSSEHHELKECIDQKLRGPLEEFDEYVNKSFKDWHTDLKIELKELLHEAMLDIMLYFLNVLKADTICKLTEVVLLFLDVNDDEHMDMKEFNGLAQSIHNFYQHGFLPGQGVMVEKILQAFLCLADKDGNEMISREEIRRILEKIREFSFVIISVSSAFFFAVLKHAVKSLFQLTFQAKMQILNGNESELTMDEIIAFLEKLVPCTENWTSLMLSAANDQIIPVLEDTVNEANNCGQTALHIAAKRCHVNTVKHLLTSKAYADIEDNMGRTPLDVLEQSVSPSLAHGVVKLAVFKDKKGKNPLDAASCADLLRQHGSNGWTELMVLAEQGKNIEVASLLRRMKAAEECLNDDVLSGDVHVKNKAGYTALHMAVKSGDSVICQDLIKARANPNIKSKDGITPIDLAISNKTYTSVAGFRNDSRLKVLQQLIESEKEQTAEAIIEVEDFSKAVKTNNRALINQILDKKMGNQKTELINKPNLSGISSFHEGLSHAKYDLCKLLLQGKASIGQAVAPDNESLVFKVLTSHRSRAEISTFLKDILKLEMGENTEKEIIAGELFRVVQEKQVKMVEILLDKQLRASWKGQSRDKLEIINWKSRDDGLTSLHSAAAAGSTDMCRALLHAGADPDILTGPNCKDVRSSLSILSTSNVEKSADRDSEQGFCNARGEIILPPNKIAGKVAQLECTALYLAAEKGHTIVCQTLLVAKSDPSICVCPLDRSLVFPSLVLISGNPPRKYDGVYWTTSKECSTLYENVTYTNLFDNSKRLQCCSKLDISKMKFRMETDRSFEDGMFNYSYADKIEWYILKEGATYQENLSEDEFYREGSNMEANSFHEKYLNVVSKFELFTPLYIAAANEFYETCRAIIMHRQHSSECGLSPLIYIPDEVVEISGAGEIGANGIYIKQQTYFENGGMQPSVGSSVIHNRKFHQHPLIMGKDYYYHNCARCEQKCVDGYGFACKECSYYLCMKCFNMEGSNESVYTHIYSKNYNLNYSNIIRGTHVSGWALVNDGTPIYKVEGKQDVTALIYGTWLPCGGRLPVPTVVVSELNKAQIVQIQSVN
jgi:ankyrin repeat protein